MKKSRILATSASCLVFLLIVHCGTDGAIDNHKVVKSEKERLTSKVPTADMTTQVQGNNAFALDLYHKIRSEGANLFYSPHSISAALAMLYAGARNNTAEEIAQVLHFTLAPEQLHPMFNELDQQLASRGEGSDDFKLSVANALWGRPDGSYLPSFLDHLALYYGAGMHLVDFNQSEAARKIINDWVAGMTEDRIKDLLQQGDIGPTTALVLTNAIYFNASWQEPFEEGMTAPHAFDADGAQVQVEMMSGFKNKARYAKAEGYEAVELPFEGEELSMLVLVPDQGTFRAFQEGLDLSTIEQASSQLVDQDLILELPKFEFTKRYPMKSTLMAMGMKDAFNDFESDFSGIVDALPGSPRMLVVKKVIHQAFVKVNEEGTEAAAATVVVMADAGVSYNPTQPVKLTVDRPFLFVIRDNATGAILFLGHVVDPNA